MANAIILSCEHGGNRIPRAYARLFASAAAKRALESHRGYDIGALSLARRLQRTLDCELHYSETSRLLVDLNRSRSNPALLSEFSSTLKSDERAALLLTHYGPQRDAVQEAIDRQVQQGHCVLHLAVHSFVRRLNKQTRTADIGLLYDPSRIGERALCERWQLSLAQRAPTLRTRRNYPYRGNADGLTTALRNVFPANTYLGIEIEVNQHLFEQSTGASSMLARLLVATLPAVEAP